MNVTLQAALRAALTLGVVTVLSQSALGCSKKHEELTTGPVTTPPSASQAAPAVSAPPGPSDVPGETLYGRLQREAQSRPSIKPSADDIFAAFDKAGSPVPQRKQSLGSTYHAAYCTGGYTSNMALAVNVCEYADDVAAEAGADYAKTVFPNMKNRFVSTNKSTILIIVDQNQDPKTPPLRAKITNTYAGL
jgi:hypothetical protein